MHKHNYATATRLSALLIFVTVTPAVPAADLIARWTFDETAPPYIDSGSGAIQLMHDATTTEPLTDVGIEDRAVRLNWQNPPGVATRLSADHSSLQMDSFGFSFWLNPAGANPFDTLLAKETAFDGSLPSYERMCWQVHLLQDEGSVAAVEFLVRGDDRTHTNFFGAVVSSPAVPLYTDAAEWIHIAGGYDSASGTLVLFVNGENAEIAGMPGASCSGGAPLSVGSARNGDDFVAFAAGAFIDELQIYGAPLSREEVALILDNPLEVPKDPLVIRPTVQESVEDFLLHFDMTAEAEYIVEASTHLPLFETVTSFENDLALVHDSNTLAALSGAGMDGSALLLRSGSSPAVPTRLFAEHPSIQSDSFGFSFWLKPDQLEPWANVVAKEMDFDDSVPDTKRTAWQLRLLNDVGTGHAFLELIVRGDDRTQGDHFGSVTSTTALLLYTNTAAWTHIAGGYDSASGDVRLFVNGAESVAANGVPGARHSDGKPLSAGTAMNGPDVVQTGIDAWIDDLQIYKGPLNAANVGFLMNWPGRTLDNPPDIVVRWRLNEPHPPCRNSARAVIPGSVEVTRDMLDAVFGTAPRNRVFFRVLEVPGSTGFNACE
ncbi:MAG: LamG domain-containing protein [Verrucomicrobia bacterium]|nr:LamG domain-containing protein [Verrucomicrobiota bacterium]